VALIVLSQVSSAQYGQGIGGKLWLYINL
jgi:hypothetical protein